MKIHENPLESRMFDENLRDSKNVHKGPHYWNGVVNTLTILNLLVKFSVSENLQKKWQDLWIIWPSRQVFIHTTIFFIPLSPFPSHKQILHQPCFIVSTKKNREVLRNSFSTLKRFPEGEAGGKSWGQRGWISQYIPSFGGPLTFSHHQSF